VIYQKKPKTYILPKNYVLGGSELWIIVGISALFGAVSGVALHLLFVAAR
jgi:hypothetical protein